MLSGLLITIDIFVCIALVVIVLLQRSEGGAFGMGGGPTGLVTARGAGDLLTRTTWVLFAIFLGLSLGLSLLGAHDRATSSLLERLKLQRANPNAISQPLVPPPGPAPPPAAPLQAPAPSAAIATPSAARSKAHAAHHALAAPPISLETAPSASNASTAPPPPTLVAPPPKADEAPSGPAPAAAPQP